MCCIPTGWKFTGTLCAASSTDHGCLWEYPNLVKLPQAERKEDGTVAFEYKDQEVGVASEASRDHVLLFGKIHSKLSSSLPNRFNLQILGCEAHMPFCLAWNHRRLNINVNLNCTYFAGEDAPVNPCIYYCSTYDSKNQKFDLENGKGPYRWVILPSKAVPNVHPKGHGKPCQWFLKHWPLHVPGRHWLKP